MSSTVIRWAWYELLKPDAADPVLYVFDVVRWPGIGTPVHGDLVAVSQLPNGQRLQHRATRLQRQSAYLLGANPKALFGPDLAHLLRAVIPLSIGSGDSDFDDRPTGEMFPRPTEDPCYAALLTLPMERPSASVPFGHSLHLPCYVSTGDIPESEIAEFVSHMRIA
jgi:hypothetical protein